MPYLAASLGVGMEGQSCCWLLAAGAGGRDGRSAGVLSTEERMSSITLFRKHRGSLRAGHGLVWDRLWGLE